MPEHNSKVDYSKYHSDYVPFRFTSMSEQKTCFIPEDVNDFFDDEFDYRNVTNCDELKELAVAIFIGALLPQEVPNTGSGGGGESNLPWRDKDDDDLKWARRCAKSASKCLGIRPRIRKKR